MSPVLLGILAAIGWGTHDFAARFTGSRVGIYITLLGVTVAGFVGLTLWMLFTGAAFPALQLEMFWLVALMGACFALATLWIYEAISRGPFALVSPVVGSYPVTTMLFFVAIGTRPSFGQWCAIAAVVIGVMLVAAVAPTDTESAENSSTHAIRITSPEQRRGALFYAGLSHIAFTISLTASQFAAPVYGELQATWLSRIVGLALVGIVVWRKRAFTTIPLRWTPVVASMGLFDVAALVAISSAGHAPGAELATVVSSIFGIVAIMLAWIFLRERVTWLQWLGIAIVFSGTAYLGA